MRIFRPANLLFLLLCMISIGQAKAQNNSIKRKALSKIRTSWSDEAWDLNTQYTEGPVLLKKISVDSERAELGAISFTDDVMKLIDREAALVLVSEKNSFEEVIFEIKLKLPRSFDPQALAVESAESTFKACILNRGSDFEDMREYHIIDVTLKRVQGEWQLFNDKTKIEDIRLQARHTFSGAKRNGVAQILINQRPVASEMATCL